MLNSPIEVRGLEKQLNFVVQVLPIVKCKELVNNA